jgi:hypothetical protein
MATGVRTVGWTTWVVILVVVALTLVAGLLYVSQ